MEGGRGLWSAGEPSAAADLAAEANPIDPDTNTDPDPEKKRAEGHRPQPGAGLNPEP